MNNPFIKTMLFLEEIQVRFHFYYINFGMFHTQGKIIKIASEKQESPHKYFPYFFFLLSDW